MAISATQLTDKQAEALAEAAQPLFAAAVAQGLHAPFALDCDYWGREYANRLFDAITEEEA